MQYGALYNGARSLYFASYSTGDETLSLDARALNDHTLALSISHYPFLSEGAWRSPLCGFALLPGDWHGATDLYAGHMKRHFVPPDPPAWLKRDFHGWAQIFMRREGEGPAYRYSDPPEVYERVRRTGLNTLHIAGWCGDGFDTLYPDFDVDPQLGSAEDLRAALDGVRALGGHAVLYTNGRLVDPDSSFYLEGGDRTLCLDESGAAYEEGYGTSVVFNVACPSCEDYTDYYAQRLRAVITNFGAHAVQIDQISCTAGFFCFDASHPHPTPATNFLGGTEARLKNLREMYRSRLRQVVLEEVGWLYD